MRRPIIELLTLPLLFGPLGCPSFELDDAFEVRSGGVQTPGNPEFVCPLRWAGAPGDERALPYCATADLLGPQPLHHRGLPSRCISSVVVRAGLIGEVGSQGVAVEAGDGAQGDALWACPAALARVGAAAEAEVVLGLHHRAYA
jgi:hypothetical protein